jgi:hypothetical protein
MFITKEDFRYFERLHTGLKDLRGTRFLNILLKSGGRVNHPNQFCVVEDDILDQRGIEPQELITRSMIKEAYKDAKEVN